MNDTTLNGVSVLVAGAGLTGLAVNLAAAGAGMAADVWRCSAVHLSQPPFINATFVCP